MSELKDIRWHVIKAINQLKAAERICQEEAASVRGRSRDMRSRVLANEDSLERQLLQARTTAQTAYSQAESMLRELNLRVPQPARYTLPRNLSVDQQLSHINQLAQLSAGMLAELTLLKSKLEIERRKWWKFW